MGKRCYKYEPASDYISLQQERDDFLNTVARTAPSVLEDLGREPFDLYPGTDIEELISASDPPDEQGGGEWDLLTVYQRLQSGELDYIPSLTQLHESLLTWQLRSNLVEQDIEGIEEEEKWVLSHAFCTLANWYSLPTGQDRASWGSSLILSSSALSWHTKPLERLPRFDGLKQTGEEYVESIRREAEQRIEDDPILSSPHCSHRKAYVRLVEERARNYVKIACENYNRNQQLRKVSPRPKLEKHMEWAVLFQVLGRSYDDIAREYKAKPSNVRIQVTRLLDRIGLKKRADRKRGRPSEKNLPGINS